MSWACPGPKNRTSPRAATPQSVGIWPRHITRAQLTGADIAPSRHFKRIEKSGELGVGYLLGIDHERFKGDPVRWLGTCGSFGRSDWIAAAFDQNYFGLSGRVFRGTDQEEGN